MNPEILTMPNVPKPLHGLNPRSIKGEAWWEQERQRVYASTNYHCYACGVHKTEASKYKWLEAHEWYDIDYSTGKMTLKSIQPLCHYCHCFIHSGLLYKNIGEKYTEAEAKGILENGFWLLNLWGLKCFPNTLEIAKQLKCDTQGVKAYKLVDYNLKWSDYVLIFEGKKYKSKFRNFDEWAACYGVKDL